MQNELNFIDKLQNFYSVQSRSCCYILEELEEHKDCLTKISNTQNGTIKNVCIDFEFLISIDSRIWKS